MIESLFGDDKYIVVVNAKFFVNTSEHHIVTTFNKKQAKVGYDVLSGPHESRTQWGIKFLNALDQMKISGGLKFDTNFTATLKDKSSGIVRTMPVSLHWRAMRLLALLCVSGDEFKIAQMSGVLRNIEAGMYKLKQIVNPFNLEGK